jgi:putative tryptophan/tyrosine transport system substrate-binding protein
MRRRDLMVLLCGAALGSQAARAQQKPMSVIGVLGRASADYSTPFTAAFRQGLSDDGFVEGQNVATEYRWAEGHYDRLSALAADLVGLNVDVIATFGTPPLRAAKRGNLDDPARLSERRSSGGRPDR